MSNMTYAEIIAYERVLVERDKALALNRAARALDKISFKMDSIARSLR